MRCVPIAEFGFPLLEYHIMHLQITVLPDRVTRTVSIVGLEEVRCR